MIEGLLSKHWATLQTLHFRAEGSRRTGEVWLNKAATQMIWISFHMWQHRNGFQHSENNTQLRSRKQDAHFGIREQFSLGIEDLPPSIKQMLRRPKKEVLGLSLTDQETWLRIVRHERRRSRLNLDYQRQILQRFLIQPIGPKLPRLLRTRRPIALPTSFTQTIITDDEGMPLRPAIIHPPAIPPRPPPSWKQRTLDTFFGS